VGNPVVQFEIAGRNSTTLREFYGFLFDWKFDAVDGQGYRRVRTGGRGGINGGLREETHGPIEITFYVQVTDIAGTLARAEKIGGKTILPPTKLGNEQTVAQFEDPEGHVIGLIEG
jgi:predicted enzyme related to lactoylglutathione lyase